MPDGRSDGALYHPARALADDPDGAGGREYDLKSRHSCTDLPWCVLFVVALGAFSLLYARCVRRGNLGRLYHGIDYHGRICGIDADVAYEPYLYWCPLAPAPGGKLRLALAKPICVASCPGGEFSSNSGVLLAHEVEPSCGHVAGPAGMTSYKTKLLLGRYCVPDGKRHGEAAKEIVLGELAGLDRSVAESLSTVPAAWPALLAAFLASVVLGYLYLALLGKCAEPMIWITMLLSVIGFSLLGLYAWSHAGDFSRDEDVVPEGIAQQGELAAKVLAGSCWLVALLVVCLACCLRHSISVASSCVRTASEVMFEMPSLLLAPCLKAIVKGLLCWVLLYGFLLLCSLADVSDAGAGLARSLDFGPKQKYCIAFYVLMAFWILAFVSALYQFTVAYAIVEFYYTPYDLDREKDVGCCAILDGVHVGLRHHAGSIALGSLLVALLHVTQKLIEYAVRVNKEGGGNQIVAAVLCCCMWVVRSCKGAVELLNKSAYIDMAVTSEGFCQAARRAAQTIAMMPASMALLHGATYVFAVFGAIIITLVSGGLTYVMCGRVDCLRAEDPVAAVTVSMVIAFLVALCFMNVFEIASDALIYCYGLDLHSGGGSDHECDPGGATMPAALKRLVEQHGDASGGPGPPAADAHG